MFERFHGIFRGVGKGSKRGRRRDGSEIIVGRLCIVPVVSITRRKTPAVFTISFEVVGIEHAVFIIDQGMIQILFPIVGVFILQPMGIQPDETIVGKEKRTAERETQRQFIP